MKRIIRLTESELHDMISQSVKKVIKEGTTDQTMYNRWDDIVNQLGAETVVSELYNYLNADDIAGFIDHMVRNYDGLQFEDEMGSYDEFEDEDEY